MKSANDNQFFSKLRSALGYDPSKRRPSTDIGSVQESRSASAGQDHLDHLSLLSILQEKSKITGMPISVCDSPEQAAQAVNAIITQYVPKDSVGAHVLTWRHPFIDSLKLEAKLASEALPIAVEYSDSGNLSKGSSELKHVKKLAASAICGVTTADWCLAESATLVMRNRSGQERITSLLPPVHIAVIPVTSLITNLEGLYHLIKRDEKAGYHGLTNCMTFVSGPSTTRDIESIAVSGAHGPKAVYIVVIC